MTTEFLLKNVCAVTPEGTLPGSALWIKDGKIFRVLPQDQLAADAQELPVYNGEGAVAVPGFVDLHIHGFAGFGPELGTPEALWQMSLELAKHGVTAFCPTLYCGKPHDMEALLKKLAPAFGKEKGARLIGFHLEGPFISPHKPGVMKPEDIEPVDFEAFQRLYAAADGHISNMTVAPELPGLDPLIDFCREHHILLQGGHTNATYDEFLAGAARGITHATHLFNAMSPFTHRAPGAAGAVLMHAGISCEFIGDGRHFHPDIVSFLRTVKPIENLVLITDALLPTAQKKPPFFANGEEVVFEGGVWKRKTDKVIAGSALTMAQGFKNLLDFGYTLAQASSLASTNPARIIGLKEHGRLAEGYAADIVLLDANFVPQTVFIGGQKI